MRKAFSLHSALHPKADVRCEKLKCQQLAQSGESKLLSQRSGDYKSRPSEAGIPLRRACSVQSMLLPMPFGKVFRLSKVRRGAPLSVCRAEPIGPDLTVQIGAIRFAHCSPTSEPIRFQQQNPLSFPPTSSHDAVSHNGFGNATDEVYRTNNCANSTELIFHTGIRREQQSLSGAAEKW